MEVTGYHMLRYCASFMIAVAACMLLGSPAHGQRFTFHNINVDDGLIQSQTTSLAQDRTGNLWIGTLGGLSRYDGRLFTSYTVKNGLPGNAVSAVATDDHNRVWIAGANGLAIFNGKTFTPYTIPGNNAGSITGSQQISILGDTTWWRANGSLFFVTKGKINYYFTPGGGTVSAILAEPGGLWVANEGSLCHRRANKWDTLSFILPADQKAPIINHIFRAKDSTLWLTTSNGLYHTDHNRILPYTINNQPNAYFPPLTSITQDKSGALWLGTASGVIKLSGNSFQIYNKQNGLSDNRFPDMLTDAEGNVWMASAAQGIFRFSGSLFSGLDESMGLSGAQITAIAYNRRDSLYLATDAGGLYIFSAGKVTPLIFQSPNPVITSLLYARGRLWIGTRGQGLWTFQRHIFRQYIAPDHHFPSSNITSLYADTTGRVWVGFDNGIMIWDTGKFVQLTDQRIAASSFLHIGVDSTLIATAGSGLQLYSAGLLQPFITHTIADSATINCFILQGREIWMGSAENGIIRYNLDQQKASVINKLNGLRSDYIDNIIADNEGNTWAGTGYGIHKIRIDPKGIPQVTFYGKAQGVTGMESNVNAVQKLPDGSIWFGTTSGALHYQPHTSVVMPAPTSIILESVKISGESTIDHTWYDSTDSWYGIPYHLALPYQQNNISFTFQAVTLTGEQQLLYRYRMDGLDAPWSEWAPTNSVTYPALPPGKYVFRVQCSAGGPELSYPFEIITPFQKTSWFRLAVLFTCLLLGVLIQYIISSRKERRLRLLDKLRAEEQTKIRMRTAEDFHDEVGNKLTRINVLTNVLKSKIIATPDTTRILGQIEENTSQLYSGTRDILWSLQPANDNLYEILYRIRDFGHELFEDTEITFTFLGDDSRWKQHRLPMDMSRNLIMIFKEAFNNALKYSGAKNISLEAKWKSRGVLQLILKDDGKGFDMQTVERGNGIKNMHIRTERLNGKLYIDSRKDKGTMLNLTFKIPQAGNRR
jgi:ligand-binding sensor domain-containing protein/signal transduction histidine kinase